MHSQMFDATPLRVVFDRQAAEFGAAKRMIQKHRKDGSVAFAIEIIGTRSFRQLFGLSVSKSRGLSLVGSGTRTFHSMNGIM